ncbi:hypothetical protein N7533_009098 [Penicillium manginii]|uniref:uncharacterized protein n=1 Tax=Penicillium manginii TaxID=203109 RepID=UPI0025474DFA|nr:uncharacterized protein N7533_009098 [Penicillium manginii]KAJ5744228.1 hypothetical protein N7533_009098 [Penicillium manginii]
MANVDKIQAKDYPKHFKFKFERVFMASIEIWTIPGDVMTEQITKTPGGSWQTIETWADADGGFGFR